MADEKTIARARVTVTLEVEAEGIWGDDCSIGQLRKQATDDVVMRLNRHMGQMNGARVIKSTVSAIVTEDKR